FAQKLQADRGGTEIENALDLARTTIGDAGPGDVFLLTDGHVGNWQPVVATAAGAGHRVFTVGVGSAVSDAFLQGLAAATGGHCELVTPGEGMADRVVRHFERMRAPRAKRVALHWPPGATHISPSCIGAVFEGDTVVASALFEHAPENGVAILEVESEDGAITRQELAFPAITPAGAGAPPSTVARIAAAAHLEHTDAALGTQLALRYQLLSPWTNCLVIAEREESRKPIGMPALRKVPQTLAAGWRYGRPGRDAERGCIAQSG
ncbi:MAG: VWA domain-containing protein, partial [Gammaproteobacteria bacterium]